MAERGDLDLALRSYDLAEQFDPDVPRLAYNRGIALGRKGEHEAALLLFRRAVAEEPDYGPAHGNLAWVLMELDRQAEALEEIEEALVLNGANPVDLMNRGLIHLLSGRPRLASEDFELITRLAPDNARAHYHLGNALEDRGKPRDALVPYNRAAELGYTPAKEALDRLFAGASDR